MAVPVTCLRHEKGRRVWGAGDDHPAKLPRLQVSLINNSRTELREPKGQQSPGRRSDSGILNNLYVQKPGWIWMSWSLTPTSGRYTNCFGRPINSTCGDIKSIRQVKLFDPSLLKVSKGVSCHSSVPKFYSVRRGYVRKITWEVRTEETKKAGILCHDEKSPSNPFM